MYMKIIVYLLSGGSGNPGQGGETQRTVASEKWLAPMPSGLSYSLTEEEGKSTKELTEENYIGNGKNKI